ncbi:MAG: phosphatidylglycerophosphatase A [Cardiobacteriaceae bacterium]|nr:phosphatidylglycerophosphatase A [Cardiobacteriaceae bacterium]
MLEKYKNAEKYSTSFLALVKNPVHFCAFGFGSGLINPAPGTWGTLLGVILLLPFWKLLFAKWIISSLFLAFTFIIGIYFCGKTAEDIKIHDFGGIVWDEFVGVWLVMLAIPSPLFAKLNILISAFICFILFRIFDILKPAPIRQIDAKLSGGLGIMIDDVLAAIFALAVLWIFSKILF